MVRQSFENVVQVQNKCFFLIVTLKEKIRPIYLYFFLFSRFNEKNKDGPQLFNYTKRIINRTE